MSAVEKFYCQGLGFKILAQFNDHDGIDGIIVGHPESPYHFEFTSHRNNPIQPQPTKEDLIVFYVPDTKEYNQTIENLAKHGYHSVLSLNPYWDHDGQTFEDPDGFRVVIQNAAWNK